jgi:small redox-active disulfide protein 2
MEIKVLGAGCARCAKLHEDAKKAAAQAGLGVEVAYVTDIEEVLKHDVLLTPALVVDGVVRSAGRVPGIPEMVGWFTEAARKG